MALDLGNKETSFQYQPLDSALHEIRLLHIQRTESHDHPIHCHIEQTRLQNACRYVALSYAWGDAASTLPIFIDGCRFEVTLNLEAFLRQIQAENDNPVFWIDAVCINQKDIAEKNSQVAMMGQIYSNASKVIAWLGKSQANDGQAWAFINELATLIEGNSTTIDNKVHINENQSRAISSWIASHTSPKFSTCSWMAFADLLNRPWWTRAWIVQEVVLAKEVVMMWGKFALPWNHFRITAAIVFNYQGIITRLLCGDCTADTSPAEFMFYSNSFDRLNTGAVNVRVIDHTATQRRESESSSGYFYDIIHRHKHSESTNPRDKVFAFLSLAGPNDKKFADLVVDYALSPASIYRSMTKIQLQERGTLKILNDCYGIGRPEGFSSWTPQYRPSWRTTGSLNALESPPFIVFKAASDLKPQIQFSDEDKTLLLDGVQVDTVQTVGAVYDLRPEELIDGVVYTPENVSKSWERLAGLARLFDKQLASRGIVTAEIKQAWLSAGFYPTGIHKSEAWARTTTCNPTAALDTYYSNPEAGDNIDRKWTDQSFGPQGKGKEFIGERIDDACATRRFYVTSKGFFGLGPPTTAIGDLVCVVLGGKTPFLFRPKGEYYEIVSETYTHGVMSGEVVEGIASGNYQVVTFRIR
jgi:hypothetical protein